MAAATNPAVKPRPSKNGYHYAHLGQLGAKYVTTAKMIEVHTKLGHAIADESLLVSWGPNGLGKSVANRLAAHDWARMMDLHLIEIHASAVKQTYMLTALLAGELGIDEAKQAWRTAWLVQAELASRRVLLRIDEGSYLSRDTLGVLRDMQGDGEATWALQMSGNDRFWENLLDVQPELESRSGRVVEFTAMTPAESTAFAQEMHQRLNVTDEALLGLIETQWAHGNARRWAQLLKACLDISPNARSGFDKKTVGTGLLAVARPAPPPKKKRAKR